MESCEKGPLTSYKLKHGFTSRAWASLWQDFSSDFSSPTLCLFLFLLLNQLSAREKSTFTPHSFLAEMDIEHAEPAADTFGDGDQKLALEYDDGISIHAIATHGQVCDKAHESTGPETSLKRGLKARHITMIAMGGAVGTGLIIGTGKALAQSGPGSVFISYTIVGFIVFLVMSSIGEMSSWLPLSSGFTGYASRFCDPSLGFALGWW